MPSSGDADHLRPDRLGDVPLVLASRRVYGLEVDTVLLDDVGGAYRGTISLLDAGHTRIGYLGNAQLGVHRPAPVLGLRAGHGGARPATSIRRSSLGTSRTSNPRAGAALAGCSTSPEPPTAIFSANNRNTIGAMCEIGRRIRAGAARAAARASSSFDDFELAELMPVPLTVIDHDARQLGREAATLLFRASTTAPTSRPGPSNSPSPSSTPDESIPRSLPASDRPVSGRHRPNQTPLHGDKRGAGIASLVVP